MNFNQIKYGRPSIYVDGIGSIDPEAQAVYNRIIADGGVSDLTRLNYFVVGLKTIYGTLANVPVCYDAHWIGYKLGSGTGATAGQAVAKLYTISVIQTVSDSDAQAFIYRVYNAGGELTDTEASAVNQLTIDMKAAGVWTSMKAVYPMVGASAAACAQNLISASFTGTFNGGWTYANTGVTPNGTNAFMDTGLNTFVSLSLTDSNLSIYVRNNTNAASYDLANANNVGMTGDPTYLISRYTSSLVYLGIGDNTYLTNLANLDSKGFWSGGTNGSRTQDLYKNGSLIKTAIGSGSFSNNNLYLGAANGGGTAVFFSDKQYALCSIGNGLNPTNELNFYTAVQAFQTTLNRQV